MTVSRMAEISHIPPDCVAEVFEYLRTKDKRWRSVKNKATGELALMPSNGGSDAGAFVPLHSKWPWIVALFTVGAMLIQMLIVRYINDGMNRKDVLCMGLGILGLLVFLVLKNNLQRKIKD